MVRRALAILICLSILSSIPMTAMAAAPPNIPEQPLVNLTSEQGHIGLTSEEPTIEEPEPLPDYDCSWGCSHTKEEPHNYIPFNVYGENKTSYLTRGRAAVITIDLTDAGSAGEAPLKCLTQYERDDNQHWERCFNHPGTGTYNGLYHNDGRINLANHTLQLDKAGEFSCRELSTKPAYFCTDDYCGFSRLLEYKDFPVRDAEGVLHQWDETIHVVNLPFKNGVNWSGSSNGHHYPICERCRSTFNAGVDGTVTCPGKPWQIHTFDTVKDGQATDGKCVYCLVVSVRHHEGQTAGLNYPQVFRGHDSPINQKCPLCDRMKLDFKQHEGESICALCGLRMNDGITIKKVSGNVNLPGGTDYQVSIETPAGFKSNHSNNSFYLTTWYPERGAVWGHPGSALWVLTSRKSGNTVLIDFTIPQLTDKKFQHRYELRYGGNTGIANDGREFIDRGYKVLYDHPDYVPPYGGTAVPQNGTPSSWRDTVNVSVKAKDDWSETLTFSIYDSDKTTQLGQKFTTGARDAQQYFKSDFKLVAEASAPKNIYLRATDLNGNYTDFGFQVQYVDTYAPRIQTPTIDNVTWSRSKTARFSSIEAGSRETKMSFNDGTTWANCNVSGDTYSQDYIFTGDVYSSQTRPIFFKDKLDNTSQAMFSINRLDNTKPTITKVAATINSNKTASTIVVSANDTKAGLGEGSGVKSYALSTTNVQPTTGWQTSNSFTVSANDTYYLWARDGVSLVSAVKSVNVTDIDITAPTLALTAPTNWTNGNVNITATASDAQSGLSSISGPGGSVYATSPLTYTATSNGNYSFKAEDRAGNENNKSINITCIDRVVPTLTLAASSSWTFKDVEISVTVGDDYSGLAKTVLPNGTDSTAASFKYTAKANGVYTFKTYDKAGNITTKSVTISSIDRVNPLITLSAPTAWTNTSVNITSVISDDYSGIFKTTLPDGSTNSNPINTYNVTSNDTYEYSVQDKASNITRDKIVVSCLDFVLPSILLTAPTDWTNAPFDISLVADDDYSGVDKIKKPDGSFTTKVNDTYNISQNGTYAFTVYDKAKNERTNEIIVTNFDYVAPTISVTAPTDWTNKPFDITIVTDDDYSGVRSITLPDGSTVATTTKYQVTQNGTYSFTVRDKAGNEATTSITITCFDYIAPTAVPSNLPADWLVRPHEITVTASDDYSGVKRVRTPDGEWHDTSEVKVFVFENKDYIFEVEDNASNFFTIAVPIDYVENTDPIVEVTGNSIEWTNKDILIHVKATDSQSGIRGISLDDKQWEFVDNIDYLFTGNDKYTVIAEDNVGHRTSVPLTIDKIDKDLPTATYTISPTEWTRGDVLVKVQAEDKLSGLVNSSTQRLSMSSNGTIGLQIADKAGNVLELPVIVSNIDKDNPLIDGIGIAAVSRGQAPLRIAASDKTSPIVRIEYQLVGLEDKVTDEWILFEEGVKINAPFHGDVAARAFDSAGNVSDILRREFMIDPIPPRTKARMSTLEFTQEPVTISYSARDMESGFSYTILPDKIITTEPDVEYLAETNGSYYFKSYDFAGNSTDTNVKVTNLDKDPPSGYVIESPSDWTAGNVELTLIASDSSKIIKEEPSKQTAFDNGIYTFYLEDEHGNKVNIKHTVDNIDRLSPSIEGVAHSFVATIRVEDFQSGVKSTTTPLGSSASSVLMFNVSPSTNYAISATDNAGNVSHATLYVNSAGQGSTEGPIADPPDPDKPDGDDGSNTGDGDGGNDSSGDRDKDRDKDKNSKPDDYDYGKPNKNYPTIGNPPNGDGSYNPSNPEPSASASSSTSSSSSSSSKAPHIGFEDNKPKSEEPKPKPSNEEVKKAPMMIIVPSDKEPNSVFDAGKYADGWNKLSNMITPLGILKGLSTFWLTAIIGTIWLLWFLLAFILWLKEYLKARKEEEEDDEDEDEQ